MQSRLSDVPAIFGAALFGSNDAFVVCCNWCSIWWKTFDSVFVQLVSVLSFGAEPNPALQFFSPPQSSQLCNAFPFHFVAPPIYIQFLHQPGSPATAQDQQRQQNPTPRQSSPPAPKTSRCPSSIPPNTVAAPPYFLSPAGSPD